MEISYLFPYLSSIPLSPNLDKPKPKEMCSKLRKELISQQLLQRKEAAPLAEKEPQRV
ncbi:MAG: hypothetical protein ABIJ30_12595 [bacterium]